MATSKPLPRGCSSDGRRHRKHRHRQASFDFSVVPPGDSPRGAARRRVLAGQLARDPGATRESAFSSSKAGLGNAPWMTSMCVTEGEGRTSPPAAVKGFVRVDRAGWQAQGGQVALGSRGAGRWPQAASGQAGGPPAGAGRADRPLGRRRGTPRRPSGWASGSDAGSARLRTPGAPPVRRSPSSHPPRTISLSSLLSVIFYLDLDMAQNKSGTAEK